MPGVIRLSARDWSLDGTGVRVLLPVPYAARCAVIAEGWTAGCGASFRVEDSTPISFVMLGPVAFAWAAADAGTCILLQADRPPGNCRVTFQPAGARSALAPFVPRSVRSAGHPAATDLERLATACKEALDEPMPDRAIAVLAEMLLIARDAKETHDAILAVYRHAAQRPLWRSTAFGALTAALMEEEARSAWA